MFTVFRCIFGDCTTYDGRPLFDEVIHDSKAPFGEMWGLGYTMFVFFVVVGLFNIVSAVFLERTMVVAKELEIKHLKARLNDKELFSKHAGIFIWRILNSPEAGYAVGTSLADDVDRIVDWPLERSLIQKIANDDEVASAALDALDIDPEDQKHISQIADYNQAGSVSVVQLLNVLQRLRGIPRRSDIISVELVCQGILSYVLEIHSCIFASSPKPPEACSPILASLQAFKPLHRDL